MATRRFGGRIYKLYKDGYPSRASASLDADRLRRSGKLARIVPSPGYKWAVYIRGQ